MSLGDRIRKAREDNGLSQAQLAKLVGAKSGAVISNWENDLNKPDADKMVAICKVLNISASYLLDYYGKQGDEKLQLSSANGLENELPVPHIYRVQVVGAVRCGPNGLAYEDVEGGELADVPNPRDYFYLRATGHSMEPKILDGDFVLVHIQHDVESGELAVVVIDGEEGTLKKVIKKSNAVILQAFNPEYPPRVFTGPEIQTLCIAGKVVQLMRKM